MKSKILRRLIIYAVAPLAIFAIVISTIFATLFSSHNFDIHRSELERQALTIASSLSAVIEDLCCRACGGISPMRKMHDLSDHLRFIEDIAMSDIWIIDLDLLQITAGYGNVIVKYEELPEGAEQLITLAFDGKTAMCEYSFGFFFDTPFVTVTVATPITMQDGKIVGTVLLHTQVSGLEESTTRGLILLLYSMLIAVLISVCVAILLSSRFTLPLNKMKDSAMRIRNGDYNVKTDITQSDEIGDLAAVLDSIAEKLALADEESKKLEKLKRNFVANISHELRTPVTVIRGSLEAICDGLVVDLEETIEYSHQMLEECKYLERLVSDLLDLSRLQNVEFSMELHDVCLRKIIEDSIRCMKEIAKQKNVEIVFTCSENDYKTVADYGRLRQMLIILLDNAIKFSPICGKVNISLSKTAEQNPFICIRDQGPGIPLSDIDHMFERFYKARSEENKTGTGLGLAIAKEIVQRHEASILAANSPEGGLDIIVTFLRF